MGSLGDQHLLHRLGVVDDDAFGRAQSDAENVAIFLLKKIIMYTVLITKKLTTGFCSLIACMSS
jgi:hypothetical protein